MDFRLHWVQSGDGGFIDAFSKAGDTSWRVAYGYLNVESATRVRVRLRQADGAFEYLDQVFPSVTEAQRFVEILYRLETSNE